MKFCWFRLYVSEKELNLVFETLPYRINSTDFFIFRQGKKMESNPWQVKSIQAFNCFKCPECMFFSQEELDFKAHAMKNHPMSNAFFTGKSFSEALILESVNPQFYERLFIVSPEKCSSQHVVFKYCFECQNKTKKQFMYTTCSELVVFMY